MLFVNKIESKIDLNSELINLGELVDEILSDSYDEENIEEELNNLGGLKGIFEDLDFMFTTLFELTNFTSINGYSIIQISNSCSEAKKCLHRFLTHKSSVGGTNANTDGSAALFEEISANAVCNFLGENSRKIFVGEGRQRLTEEALRSLTETLAEPTGVYHNLPAQAKDDGVDFIVYKPIDTRNLGNLIILGQACIGKNYTSKKAIYERWQSEYITFSIRPPTTLLSIVHLLEDNDLQAIQSQFSNSLVFDRARILKYFDDSDETLNNKIIDFVNQI